MDEHRMARALTAAGIGGSALAAGALLVSVMYATTPEGSSPAAQLQPCFSAHCSSSDSRARTASPRATTATTVTTPPASPKTPSTSPPSTPPKLTVSTPNTWSNPVPTLARTAPVVAMDSAGGSLVMVGSDGGVFPLGRAGFYGSLGGKGVQSNIAAAAVDPQTGGYWLAGIDGSVFALNADFYGSLGKNHPSAPVTAMAATPHGDGYWLVTSAGGVFSFGAATFHGSLLGHGLHSRVVDIVATPDGGGYWLVSEAGGIYAFGDAGYFGSVGSHPSATPIVAMAATATGRGYWLVSAGGGVFNFGDASFEGSAINAPRQGPMAAMVPTPTGSGYWLADQSGNVFSYGDAVRVDTTPRPQVRSVAAAAAAAVAATPPVPTNLVHYGAGSSGLDISTYQCQAIPSAPTGIAVVQVTGGGLDEAPNPCYAAEARWAGANLSAYIYMDGLPQPAPASALHGPHGQCTSTMYACQSYNYGFNEASYYVLYSRLLGIDPKLWWLDVERYSSWNSQGSNALVVQGALDALKADHVHSGIYSTAAQWQEITGGMAVPGEAEWVPGAGMRAGAGYTATGFCATPGKYSFGGGRLDLVQYGYSGPFPGSYSGPTTYDQDYACK